MTEMQLKTSELSSILEKRIENISFDITVQDVGYVITVGDGIASVYGLKNAKQSEIVLFSDGSKGLILSLESDHVNVVIIGNGHDVQEGSEVKSTGKIITAPIGPNLLGRVVDVMGNPLDGLGDIEYLDHKPLDVVAPGVISRQSVTQPLQTGIKSLDLLVPIGRGQRELIIGDMQTGKTAIALDSILNQQEINENASSDSDKLFCIYVAIGQKDSKVVQLVKTLEDNNALSYSIVVVAGASDSAVLQYLAPYAATTMGEYFRDNGMHALIVYDDLSKHAIAYRQISLLLRRPPGREAYPGDVFYLHSRLLERSAKLSDDLGGGSLSSFPIIETQGGDISSYIPTNVISITDGQIFLNSDLFYQGFRPAIDVGLSVSRVGSSAQVKIIRKIAGSLKGELSQYRELKVFSQFASDLDDASKKILDRGDRLMELLKQTSENPVNFESMAVLFYVGTKGYLDALPTSQIFHFMEDFLEALKVDYAPLLETIRKEKDLTPAIEESIQKTITKFLDTYTVND